MTCLPTSVWPGRMSSPPNRTSDSRGSSDSRILVINEQMNNRKRISVMTYRSLLRSAVPAAALLAVLTGPVGTAWLRAQTPGVQATPAATSPGSVVDPNSYRIGAGDVLEINVWKEPEASVPSAIVRPDGKITLPLIKEVEVEGLTPVELQKLLASKLDHHGDMYPVDQAIKLGGQE